MAARLELTLFWHRPHYFYCVNQVVLILTSWHLRKKSREICIKQGHPQHRLHSWPGNYANNCKMAYWLKSNVLWLAVNPPFALARLAQRVSNDEPHTCMLPNWWEIPQITLRVDILWRNLVWKSPKNRSFHPVIEIDLNLFFCHCSKSATNLALVGLCSGIARGCKTTTSTAKTMESMHLNYCRELRFHPRNCQLRMPLQRNRRQHNQQLRNHRPKVLLLQQSHLLVSLISTLPLITSSDFTLLSLYLFCNILISTSVPHLRSVAMVHLMPFCEDKFQVESKSKINLQILA